MHKKWVADIFKSEKKLGGITSQQKEKVKLMAGYTSKHAEV